MALPHLGACSSQARAVGEAPDAGEATAEVDASTNLEFDDGSAPTERVEATLKGNVRAPNVQIPISGALVYVTDLPPAPRPTGVHCDECVTLSEDVPYALSGADGTFELPSFAGERWLVVQKGGFRRARKITITPGEQQVQRPLTTLPATNDPSKNDEVPKMAVIKANFDAVEDSLQELGLQASAVTIKTDLSGFLRDANQMSQFEIIFIPCGRGADYATDPQIVANLRSFVESGGRVYATDWHYDFVHNTWPSYITWEDQSTTPCSGCSSNMYDANATVDDQGLSDWMKAQNIASFQLERNYTTITNVNARPGKDKDGNDVTITPKVWVRGSKDGKLYPTTVSFEQGCGRVLFSTYHTESSTTVMPQERALLYILLEVSVCTAAKDGVVPR